MIQKRVVVLVAGVGLLCGACKSPGPSGRSYSLTRHSSVAAGRAFAAAEQALGERFHIRVRDPGEGLLRTEPVMETAPREDGRLGDRLRTPRRVRKSVEVRIEPEGDGVAIGCKALVEENQAGAHRAFEREHALSDIPSDTPADWGAGATAEQEAVWQARGRDRDLERQICRAIDEILAQRTEPGPQGAPGAS